jgi:hypothetical protein
MAKKWKSGWQKNGSPDGKILAVRKDKKGRD